MLDDEFWLTLDAGLAAAQISLNEGARSAIDVHVRLLVAWNAQINLTALRTPEQIARNHMLDSLIAQPALSRYRPTSLLDLGSGGGFPGLPLAAVMPLERVALVDSVGKKARFLDVAAGEVERVLEAAAAPAPEIGALAERAEDLADDDDQREGWDLVVARAVGHLAEVVELGIPLTTRGGHVVAWKRDAADGGLRKEIAETSRICQAVGGSTPRIITLPAAESVGLPGHCLVVIEKRRPTSERYPRTAAERRRLPLLS